MPASSAYTSANAANREAGSPTPCWVAAISRISADVPVRLAGGECDINLRLRLELGQVGQHQIEHAVVGGRPHRLREQPGESLVDRRGAHLDRARLADPIADDHRTDMPPGSRGHLVRPGPDR